MDAIEPYKKSRAALFRLAGIDPQSTYIGARGPIKQIHYLEMGEGPPTVLIHGGGSHSSEWYSILKPLSEHFHLYVVDRPGCGLSGNFDYSGVDFRTHATEFVKNFLDAIGLEKVTLIGNSIGGYFSICFALACPQRVEKLLLIGAPAGICRRVPGVLRALGTRGLNQILLRTLARPSVKGAKSIFKQILIARPEQQPEIFYTHSRDSMALVGGMKAFSNLLQRLLDLRGWRRKNLITEELGNIQAPVYLLWGDKDAFESPQSGGPKVETIPRHEFKVIKNAGHLPWLDQPESCSKEIIRMLTSQKQVSKQ